MDIASDALKINGRTRRPRDTSRRDPHPTRNIIPLQGRVVNFLFPRRRTAESRVYRHRQVWLTETGAVTAILREAAEHTAANLPVVLTAHFPDDMGFLVEALQQLGRDFDIWRPRAGRLDALRDLDSAPGTLFLVAADQLPDLEPIDSGEAGALESFPAALLVLHHHPCRGADDRIVRFAAALPLAEVCFFTSLDHPLFAPFAGGEVSTLLRTLGATDSTPVDGPIAFRPLERAQRIIARRRITAPDTDSAGDWMICAGLLDPGSSPPSRS